VIWQFLVLNLINYICDYPLQNFYLAEQKQKCNYALFVHSFIWAMGIAIGLRWFDNYADWKLIMLFAGHFLIDGWKCRRLYKCSDRTAYYIDQTLHKLQIVACVVF
jgi:hypothetical protein